MEQLLKTRSLILMEGAIIEQLRRTGTVRLHETLVNAPLIYDESAAKVLGEWYGKYMDLALNAGLPSVVITPSWRTNKARVFDSGFPRTINQDAVAFLQKIRASKNDRGGSIQIGGMVGCRNDCYLPEEGLSASEAEHFHSWQIEQLVEGGVDFLTTQTIPTVQEALGIAKAMEITGVPYVISFVINRAGYVLDGTCLQEAIEIIDSNTEQNPLGYMVNCAYPSFLCPAKQPARVFKRLIGYQANASSLDHCDLDKADELKADDISEWGDLMLELNQTYGVQILGGCCGTGVAHLQYLIDHRKSM